MATPPLPDVSTLRVKLDYNQGSLATSGNRLFFKYGGTAPTAANCATLASDISGAWGTHIAPLIQNNFYLTEVDVLDITTVTGLSGAWTGSVEGTRGSALTPASVATNIEYDISRRYRGGKPRIYLPPGSGDDLADESHWSGSFTSAVGTGWAAFISEIEALSVGAVGSLTHINLSYYSGVNTSTPPWRGPGFKYPPKYRDVALSDVISGYSVKTVVGSQRRRRTSTTP